MKRYSYVKFYLICPIGANSVQSIVEINEMNLYACPNDDESFKICIKLKQNLKHTCIILIGCIMSDYPF